MTHGPGLVLNKCNRIYLLSYIICEKKLIDEIKAVNGTFTPIFHNYTFSDSERWEGFRSLFNLILESAE